MVKLGGAAGRIIKQHLLPFTQAEFNGKLPVPHGMTIWQRCMYLCVDVSEAMSRIGRHDLHRTFCSCDRTRVVGE